jgi:hypothetical protein
MRSAKTLDDQFEWQSDTFPRKQDSKPAIAAPSVGMVFTLIRVLFSRTNNYCTYMFVYTKLHISTS